MRKILVALAAVAAVCLAGLAAPASGTMTATSLGDVGEVAGAAPHSHTGWKMGRLPAQSTLCVANGAGSYIGQVIGRLNNSAYGPTIYVLNRCSEFSIENRATVTTYADSTSTCAKFTQVGRVWDSAQGYYVFNQNPVLWYNTSDYCMGQATVQDHRIDMFMEYLLGLNYVTTVNYNATICATNWCYYNVRYPTTNDKADLGGIYGRKA